MSNVISAFVAKYAGWVLIVLLATTIVPAYFIYKGLSLNVVLEEMLPEGANNVELFLRFGDQFGGANTTLIEVKSESGNVYSTQFLEKYKKIAEEIYYHPSTYRHLSQSMILRKTKAITGGGGTVEVDAILWPDLPRDSASMEQFRRAVNSQYRGFLVSDDESSMMIIADFKDDSDFESILGFFLNLRIEMEDDDLSLNFVGRPILLGYIYQALDSVVLILAISLAIVAMVLYLYFRTWIGVFVPMTTAVVATIWGLGTMGAFGYNLDPLLVLLPAFIFAIVLSHGVQLTTRILDNVDNASTRPDNLRLCTKEGLARVMVPSTAAIFTDAAGFGVLGLVAIPSIKGLAIICGLWLLSIIPALILAASLLCLMKPPVSHNTGSKLLNKIWTTVIDIEDHKFIVIGVTLGLFALGMTYASNLTVGDTKGSAILWPDARYNLDSESINTRYSFLGTDLMQVYIEGDKNTMLDPTVYHQIEAMDRYMYEHMREVRPAQSLVPIIKLVNSVLYEGDPSYEILPDTKEEIGFDIYMYRSRGEPGDFAAFTNVDWEIGNVSFFLEDHSVPTIENMTKTLEGFFTLEDEIVSEADFLYSGGQIGIVEALNREITESNIKIMIAIAIVIGTCILIYYRSPTVAFILLFSLATANSLTYAFMAWKEVGLNVSTLPLAALGVGLGVDYGIYMVDRIKEEYAKATDTIADAIHRAFLTSGNAIFVTAITMIGPLLPWAFMSPLRFQSEMGMLLGLVLFMNMLGSLLFLPAALAAFKPKSLFPERNSTFEPETAATAAINSQELPAAS
ncbi:MAG TPA: multidrug transporter [Pseudomonadales bacterium]|nr:multidrug transporter [Gammaproteobacteria bacterium]HIL84786.1 multidrug transporter [Pseudomonadales bacterium]